MRVWVSVAPLNACMYASSMCFVCAKVCMWGRQDELMHSIIIRRRRMLLLTSLSIIIRRIAIIITIAWIILRCYARMHSVNAQCDVTFHAMLVYICYELMYRCYAHAMRYARKATANGRRHQKLVRAQRRCFGTGFNGYLASWVPSSPGKHTFQNCTQLKEFLKLLARKRLGTPLG